MDRSGQRHAGLLLAYGEHAVADVLSADTHCITAPLCGVESERQRQARLGTYRIARLEHRNLILGPAGVAIRLWHLDLDAEGWVVAQRIFSSKPIFFGSEQKRVGKMSLSDGCPMSALPPKQTSMGTVALHMMSALPLKADIG